MLPKDAGKNCQAVRDMFLYSYDAYKSVFTCGTAVAKILTIIAGGTRRVMMT